MNRPPTAAERRALPSLRLVRTPRFARGMARLLLAVLVTSPFLLLFLPWQQTLPGKGRLIALDPGEREQFVTATIDGLILKWNVRQQEYVEKDAVIVELTDTDPGLERNLGAQRAEFVKRIEEFQLRIAESERALVLQVRAVEAAKSAAERNRDALANSQEALAKRQIAAKADREFRQTDFKAYQEAATGGPNRLQVVSRLEYLQRLAAKESAEARVLEIEADLRRLDAQIAQAAAQVINVEATGSRDATALRRQIATDRAEQNALAISLNDLDVRISRFRARVVRAPRAGWIQDISSDASQGGMYVKTGQKLATIVPVATTRSVELTVSGIDAPLILAHRQQTGEWPHVRLQFQGYPALQFQGWPSAAFGTFGGRMIGMNPTDNGKGEFAVLVTEDRSVFGESDRWPPAEELRQGNLALGWVFLNRVTLGRELWRRLNGFSPVATDEKGAVFKEPKRPKIKPD